MTPPTEAAKLREEFEEKFGHDHPFNGECSSVNMGNDCDCRTKDMVKWIESKLTAAKQEERINIGLSLWKWFYSKYENEDIEDAIPRITGVRDPRSLTKKEEE